MELTGYRFNLMLGAVAFLSNDNNNPTKYVGTGVPQLVMDIEVTSENRATATVRQVVGHSHPYYIGAIATVDGSTVFWVNNTRPLP